MSVIKIKVVDRTATIINAPMISAGGINTDYVIFTFDSTWEGYGKNAIFYRDDNKADIHEVAIDGQGKAIVPREIVATNGKIWVGVIGVDGINVLTSEVIWYEIVDGFYSASLGSQSAEASIYSQMLTIAGQMEALYNALQADQAAFEEEIEDRISDVEDEVAAIDVSNYATKTELNNLVIGTNKIENKAVTAAKLDDNAVRLRFTNVEVLATAFLSNGTYADFQYRAEVALTGVTAAMKPDVCFSLADAISGIFAPIAESYAGGIYIYASVVPENNITIPVIDLVR